MKTVIITPSEENGKTLIELLLSQMNKNRLSSRALKNSSANEMNIYILDRIF